MDVIKLDFKVFCSSGFSIVSFVFAVVILFIYITKRKRRNFENIVFTGLLFFNVLGCLAEFLHVHSMYFLWPYPLLQVFCKLHSSFVVASEHFLSKALHLSDTLSHFF